MKMLIALRAPPTRSPPFADGFAARPAKPTAAAAPRRPVSIRALKRFVTSQFGPETGDFTHHAKACNQQMLPPNRGDYERIAVVGAGVAGLTVAHDLTHIGYKVTVFEAYSTPGGMLTAGVPVFRLPRELVMAEIDAILSLGIELKCNQRLGRDFTIQSLRDQGYKAIFLGVGLPKGRKLDLPGADSRRRLRRHGFSPRIQRGQSPSRRQPHHRHRRRQRSLRCRPLRRAPSGCDQSLPTKLADMHTGDSTALDVARSAMRLSGERRSSRCLPREPLADARRRD